MHRRLVYLHQYFAIPSVPGGIRSWEFSCRLVQDGWHVSVVCGSSYLPNVNSNQLNTICKQQMDAYLDKGSGSFDIKTFPVEYSNLMSFPARILAFLKFTFFSSVHILKKRQPSLYFATSTPLTIAIPVILNRYLKGNLYIFEVRDLWPEIPIAMGVIRSPLLIYIARKLERLAYQNAHHIIVLSPGMKNSIVKSGVSSKKISIIPNACDNQKFNIPEKVGLKFLEDYPQFLGGPLIVYTGTMGHINGVSYLVYLAKYLLKIIPNAKFLVVGSGACKDQIQLESRELGLLNRNFWIWHPLPKVEMPRLLSACTVATSLFLPIPEMEHNSANKFFDALAAGRPLVINYGGWQKEILEESGAGIVIPGDDPEFGAVKLGEFLNDSKRLRNAKSAARQLADNHFSREILYGKLKKIFDEAVSY